MHKRPPRNRFHALTGKNQIKKIASLILDDSDLHDILSENYFNSDYSDEGESLGNQVNHMPDPNFL